MYELDKARFGAMIAAVRKEKGLTQRELAQRLYVSDKAVSKWETGVSLPDTALLIPLAEMLGVTVTELLTGRRDPEPELAVKTVLSYSEDKARLSKAQLVRRAVLFTLLLLISGAEYILLDDSGAIPAELAVLPLLSAFFAAYFFFIARSALPAYYDQNRISHMSQGVFRLNLPGLRFTNGNWPHILRVGRIWSGSVLVLYFPLCRLAAALLPPAWALRAPVLLAVVGLFLPLYIAAKKYE